MNMLRDNLLMGISWLDWLTGIGIGVATVAGLWGLREAMVKRLSGRVAFGSEIARQTVWQERIAESRCMIEQARLLVLKAAEAYAKEIVLADFEEAGDNDVLRKVTKDLEPKGVTEQQIRTRMTELLTEAVAQIKKSG